MHGLEKLENTYKNMLITHYPLHTLEKNHEEDVDTVIKATHNNEFLMLLKAKHAIHNQNYNDALNLFSKHANVGWLSLSKDHWLKIVKAAYINSKEEPTEFNKAIQKKFNKQLLMSLQIKQASKHAGDQKHTKVLQILEKYKIFRAKTSMDLTDEIIDTYLNSPKRPSKRAEKNIRKLLNKYTHLKLRAAYCNNHKQHNEVIRLFKKASGWFWQPGSWKTKKIYTFKKIEDDTKFWQARIEHAFINVEKIPPQTYRNRVKLLYGNEYLTLLFAKRCLKRGRPDRALQLFAAASQNNDGDYVYLDHDEQWRSLIKMAKNTLSETSYTTITQQFGSDFKKSLRSSFQHIDSPLSEEPNLNLTPDGRTQETSLENEYVIIDENDPETEQKDPDEAASLSTSETETAKSSAQPTR